MAVSVSRAIADGLYTPFRGYDREAGAIGTVYVRGAATGTATGGTVSILFTLTRLVFGFHPILVVTRVMSQDDLAAVSPIRFGFNPSGNERMQTASLNEIVASIAGDSSLNWAQAASLGVLIEPTSETEATVFQVVWGTNTDTKEYEAGMFGVLYDAEAIARGKSPGKAPDELLTGIR